MPQTRPERNRNIDNEQFVQTIKKNASRPASSAVVSEISIMRAASIARIRPHSSEIQKINRQS
jgi:hypothetical protein